MLGQDRTRHMLCRMYVLLVCKHFPMFSSQLQLDILGRGACG